MMKLLQCLFCICVTGICIGLGYSDKVINWQILSHPCIWGTSLDLGELSFQHALLVNTKTCLQEIFGRDYQGVTPRVEWCVYNLDVMDNHGV